MTSERDANSAMSKIRQLLLKGRSSASQAPRTPKRLFLWVPLAHELRIAAWVDWNGDQDIGTFRYTPEWLEAERAYPLDPINLPLGVEPFDLKENRGIPGVVADAGPDRWGKLVFELLASDRHLGLAERIVATSGRGVGALRVTATDDGPALLFDTPDDHPLAAIEQACWNIVQSESVDPPMRAMVLDRCCGLGGARPKAAVVINGREVIAKFQNTKWDYWDIPRVEAACLATARLAGINAVSASLVSVNDRSALLVDRFDRSNGRPIHYLSARSLVNAFGDAEMEFDPPTGRATYAAIVAAACRIGVEGAGEELFRRMAFNYAIGNTDDHLRNHGFLFDGTWCLAPAFDLVVIGGPAHELGVGQFGLRRSRDNLLSGIGDFGLTRPRASDLLDQELAPLV